MSKGTEWLVTLGLAAAAALLVAVNGMKMPMSNIAILFTALLVFIRLISAVWRNRVSRLCFERYLKDNCGTDRLILRAAPSMESWLKGYLERQKKSIYVSGIVIIAILGGIGIAVTSLEMTLSLHIPLGLLIAETAGCLSWWVTRTQNSAKTVIRNCRKRIWECLPSEREREEAARDALETEDEWVLEITSKERFGIFIFGKRFWYQLGVRAGNSVVDSERVEWMEMERKVHNYQNSTARFTSVSYELRFFYRGMEKAKKSNEIWVLSTEQASGAVLHKIRQRTDDAIKVMIK